MSTLVHPAEAQGDLRWLSREQRERIESPGSYQLLQEHLTRRYLAVRSS